jgi:hypothetical protein
MVPALGSPQAVVVLGMAVPLLRHGHRPAKGRDVVTESGLWNFDEPPTAEITQTTCRTPAEAAAAGQADATEDPPLTQDQADLVAVILAPSRTQEEAA